MTVIRWPKNWQPEARRAIEPLFGMDARVRIIVGDATAIDGTVLEGCVYLDNGVPTIIHDHSGQPSVHAWRLLSGPVLRIYGLQLRRKPTVLFALEGWTPRSGD